MKINLLINDLEYIKNYRIYSKKNNDYEKILGSFTLKSLIKSLKNPRKIKKPTFLEEMAQKYPSEDIQFSQESYSMNKKKLKLKDFFNKRNIDSFQSSNNIEKTKLSFDYSKYRKPIQIDITPTPWTYNPQYNLVFKRIPVTTIFNRSKNIENININYSSKNNHIIYKKNKKSKKIKIKTLKISNKKIKSFSNKKEICFKKEYFVKNIKEKFNFLKRYFKTNNLIKKQIYDKSNYNNNKIYHNDKKVKLVNINNKSKTQYNIRNNIPIFYKDNYAYKSQKTNYSDQKRSKNSLLKTSIENNSSQKKFNNDKKRIFDFSKMSKRNFEIILNNSALKYPSFYHYEPKFDYITQSTKAFNFGFNHDKKDYEKKKFLLKKMWCSYADLSKDYYLINNSKLN